MSEIKPRIWGIGLPRCAGQTLQQALAHFLQPGERIIHSPAWNWDNLQPTDPFFRGAVEVFAPLPWIERHYPGSFYVFNIRDREVWLQSCLKHWTRSHVQNWMHPLWRYHWTQFEDYARSYLDERWDYLNHYVDSDRWISWDITHNPSWEPLEELFDYILPDPKPPFPNKDRYRVKSVSA